MKERRKKRKKDEGRKEKKEGVIHSSRKIIQGMAGMVRTGVG